MAVAPDIHYFLQSAVSCLHMANDTYYYFLYQHPDANNFIDNYPTRARKDKYYRYTKHMDTLRDMGHYCEEQYLRFRSENREASFGASHFNTETITGQFEEFVNEFSVNMVNRGHRRLTDHAIAQADRDYGFFDGLGVIKRACMRSYMDTDGYDPDKVARSLAQANEHYDAFRSTQIEQLNDLRRSLGREEIGITERNKKRAAAYIRAQVAQDRKVAKRSVRAAERFLGADTTRLFIGGEEMRIQGRYATYVIKKTRQILSSHGAAGLSVYTKEGDIFLCNLCIYTDKVPVLDHVISLILHIRSGCEEEILSVGNPYNMKPEAYEQDWLVPYLPEQIKTRGQLVPGQRSIRIPTGMLFEVYREPDRQDRIDGLRRELARLLYDHVGEYCPPQTEFTKAMLLSGLDERRYAVTQAGREALGLDRLPTNVEMAGLYHEYLEQGMTIGGQEIIEAPLYA